MRRLLPSLLLVGCGRPYEVPAGATAYDYAPASVVTTFPDDFHTVDDATSTTGLAVRFQGDARADLEARLPDGFTLLPALEALDGWGTTGGIVLRFTAPLDPASFADARLVRLDDGATADVEVRWTDEGATAIVLPLRPLAPATRYGLVASGLVGAGGEDVWASADLRTLLDGRKAEDERLERLFGAYEALLAAAEVEDPDEVDAAVVFTTQSLFDDDEAVLAAIDASAPTLEVLGCAEDGALLECDVRLTALDFMGEDEVLDLAIGEAPAVQRTYEVPGTLRLPADGAGPFPVVVYGHGLGGDSGEGGTLARNLAAIGVAVVALDAPAHGGHPFPGDGDLWSIVGFFGVDVQSASFAVEELRDHWRSAAWDKVQLVRALRSGVDVDGDGAADLDGTRIGYSGHSLGGIMGPALLALDPDVIAGELSVPGGRVSEIVQYGETFALLVAAMRPEGTTDGDVERFFPMLQAAIERGDSANYAPRVLDGRRDVLVQMVVDDDIIPNATTIALARALGVDQAPPALLPVADLPQLGALPASGNRDGRTAVLYEFDQMLGDDGELVPATHTHIHGNAVGAEQVRHFWATRLDAGLAEVIDPFDALGLERP